MPGVGGRPLDRDALIKALRRATGTDADVHGFRSSFRTWAAERSGATKDVAEMALAHVVGGAVERSYARSDLFDQAARADGAARAEPCSRSFDVTVNARIVQPALSMERTTTLAPTR